MTDLVRLAALPAVALVLVSGVLGVQLANGGGTFEPLQSADPCVARTVTSQADGIDGLTERLVLLGIDGAACRLHVSREALTLELAQPGPRTDAEIDALRQGLLDAVQRMKDDGTLPPASELVDEALDNADLNGFLEAAIRALPDSVDQRCTEDRRRPHPHDQRPRPAQHPGEPRRRARPRTTRSTPRSPRRSRTPSPTASATSCPDRRPDDQSSVRITQRHFAIWRSRTKPNSVNSSSGPVWR